MVRSQRPRSSSKLVPPGEGKKTDDCPLCPINDAEAKIQN